MDSEDQMPETPITLTTPTARCAVCRRPVWAPAAAAPAPAAEAAAPAELCDYCAAAAS